MIKCFIVDDEPDCIELLAKYIDRTPMLKRIGSETDPYRAAQLITSKEVQPDLAFLDIHMPGYSGMDLAEQLIPYCRVIFTTADSNFAAEAFDKGALLTTC